MIILTYIVCVNAYCLSMLVLHNYNKCESYPTTATTKSEEPYWTDINDNGGYEYTGAGPGDGGRGGGAG